MDSTRERGSSYKDEIRTFEVKTHDWGSCVRVTQGTARGTLGVTSSGVTDGGPVIPSRDVGDPTTETSHTWWSL